MEKPVEREENKPVVAKWQMQEKETSGPHQNHTTAFFVCFSALRLRRGVLCAMPSEAPLDFESEARISIRSGQSVAGENDDVAEQCRF